MFILSLICLILGLLLLIVAGILFFKLDVKDAWDFIHNKRTRRSTRTSSASNRRRKSSRTTKGKTSDDARSKFGGKKSEHTGWGVAKEKPKFQKANTGDVVKSNASGVASNFDVDNSEGDTSLLEESSESETSILADESESPTGILVDDSESPTGILDDGTESPTGVLDEGTESPTGVLHEDESEMPAESSSDVEDSEKPTDVLQEDDSESPTGILSEDSESPTGVLSEDSPIKSKEDYEDSFADSDFVFKLVKNEVVIHTDEEIN